MEIKLSDVLRDMLLNGPVFKYAGICPQVDDVAERMGLGKAQALDMWKLFVMHKHTAIPDWPEALGSLFPVPAPNRPKCAVAAERAYSLGHLWGQGTYGNSRRRLLRHLIIWFKDRGM